jgi:small-conductance mechanosensitive channel
MPILADHVPVISREWLLSHGLRVAAIIVAALLLLTLSRLWVRRMQRRLEGVESLTQELDLQRVATLTQAVSYLIRVVVWTFAILLVLGEFDVNLGPLLAGAGIAGVALGFGAQSLVRDFLSGFFILLENQFGVGDWLTVSVTGKEITGQVEAISLRITQLRSFEGILHYIPNGNVLVVGNRYKGWARAIVDVGVAYGEDVGKVREVLEELFEELRTSEDLGEAFHEGPKVLGVERLGDYDVVIRVIAGTRPSRRMDMERELRQRIKQRFDQRGIEIPTAPPLGGMPPG